ncbi:hypothetical protein ABID65_009412 [Bradyrhizobium sp. S3.9.2]
MDLEVLARRIVALSVSRILHTRCGLPQFRFSG